MRVPAMHLELRPEFPCDFKKSPGRARVIHDGGNKLHHLHSGVGFFRSHFHRKHPLKSQDSS